MWTAPENERDWRNENKLPIGYLVKKDQVQTLNTEFEEIIESYKHEDKNHFGYRVDCAKQNIILLNSISNGDLFMVNPDKSWGDGVFDAFSDADCERCLIVE